MTTTSKLLLYNEAIYSLGERALSSITEVREPRLVLDNIWDSGAVDFCLEKGLWNFATRSAKIEYSPSVEPPFGYSRAFDKPVDFIRTVALCSDEFFNSPHLRYVDEAGFWFSDLDTIYVRFVSNDGAYGGDYSLWPKTFATYVAQYLAWRASFRLTQDKEKRDAIERGMNKALATAKSNAAMAEPTAFAPKGSWVMARARGRIISRDGGGRGGDLIG